MTDDVDSPRAGYRERKESVIGVPGREGQEVKANSYEGRSIGVFTSGGDSQGMSVTVVLKCLSEKAAAAQIPAYF